MGSTRRKFSRPKAGTPLTRKPGSSRRRHSTGRKAGTVRARKGKRKTPDHEREPPLPDLDAILGRFADALSFVSTATHTLIGAQDRVAVTTRYDASETIHTLTHGLNELNRVYNDLDHAIMELR